VRRLFRCINYLFVPRELAVADDWTPGVRATRRYRMQFIGSNDQNTAPWWPFSEHIGFAFFVTFFFFFAPCSTMYIKLVNSQF